MPGTPSSQKGLKLSELLRGSVRSERAGEPAAAGSPAPLCESEPQINSRERQQRNEGLYAFQSAVNSMQACKKAGPLNI